MHGNPSLDPIRLRDLGAPVFIFCLALALYTVQPYGDFFRDEDYEMGYQAASFFWSFASDVHSLSFIDGILYKVGTFAHAVFFFRHGAVPAIYISLFYGLFDVLGLTFSATLLGLPTAILGALTTVLFYDILRKADIRSWLAFSGALALALSPLFAGLSRGFATFVWIGPIFSLLLCISALQRLGHGRGSQYFFAFSVINLILSDALFFLTLAALCVTYGLRHSTLEPRLIHPGHFVRALRQGLEPVLTKRILIPVSIVLSALVLSAVFVLKYGAALSSAVPLNSLLLATRKHSSVGLEGLVLDGHWLTYPSVLLGETAPIFFVLAAGSLLMRAPQPRQRFLWGFAVLSGVGFSILIYLVKAPSLDVTHGYQIYTLIPFLLFVVLAGERAAMAGNVSQIWVKSSATLFLVGTAASCGAYLFKLPLAYSQEFAAEVFGVSKPEYGTKAAGHISRVLIEQNLGKSPNTKITVNIYRDPSRPFPPLNYGGFRVYSAPYQLNAGLLQSGGVFTHRLNILPDITTTVVGNAENDAPPMRPSCPAEMCATIQLGTHKTSDIYDILDGNSLLIRLYVTPTVEPPIAPGSYQAQTLNKAFDAANTHIEDYYPPRSAVKKQRIITAIKQRLGL